MSFQFMVPESVLVIHLTTIVSIEKCLRNLMYETKTAHRLLLSLSLALFPPLVYDQLYHCRLQTPNKRTNEQTNHSRGTSFIPGQL